VRGREYGRPTPLSYQELRDTPGTLLYFDDGKPRSNPDVSFRVVIDPFRDGHAGDNRTAE
jgi:hypothetical protein